MTREESVTIYETLNYMAHRIISFEDNDKQRLPMTTDWRTRYDEAIDIVLNTSKED